MMKTIFVFFGALCALSAQDAELRDLANTLAGQLQARNRSPVAVTTFTSDGCGPSFGMFISNRLNILLVQTGKQFEVVTRNRLEEAFKEINLQLGRSYDSATFAKIGRQVGAKALIRGDYVVLESKVSLNAEVLDVETGRIIGGHFVDVPLTADVRGLMRCGDAAVKSPVASPAAATKTAETAPVKAAPSAVTTEAGGMLFTLKSCSARPTEVTCDLTVVSPKEDRLVYLGEYYGASSMFDQDGNEYRITGVSAGNKSDNDRVHILLVRDVNVQMKVKFTVTRDVTGISLMRIAGGIDRRFNVDFRNVKVTN